MPLLAIATRSPRLGAVLFILGAGGTAIGAPVHPMTLLVEWHTSFGHALPVLTRRGSISDRQIWHAHGIPRTTAFTCLAGSLASPINLYRWIAILHR